MDILQIRNINQKFQLFCENKADFEKLDDLIRNIRDYLSKIKIDENQIIKEKTSEGAGENVMDISIEEFNKCVSTAFEGLCQNLLNHFDKYTSNIIDGVLEILFYLNNLYAVNNQKDIDRFFNVICRVINNKNTASLPLCFKLIGCVCNENKLAQESLLNANLLSVFINKFKDYFVTDNSSNIVTDQAQGAVETMQVLSGKNEGFLVALNRADVPLIILQYLSSNYRTNDPILYPGCINLLALLMHQDSGQFVLQNNFIQIALEILTKCHIEENWTAIYNLIEIFSVKYSSFNYECVQGGLFNGILSFLEPHRNSSESIENDQLLLNLLVLLTIPFNASKYLVDQKMTDSLIKLIVSSNPHFRASLCLIVGNFCYNDSMAIRLVNQDKFHEVIIDNIVELFMSQEIKDEFLISYLSILKNLAIAPPNRVAILSNKNFYRMVENVIQVNHPLILQKLFVLLRITTCASLTRTLIHDQPVLDTIIKYSTETDSYLLCRPSALLLLLTLIVEAKKEFKDFNFINEQMLMEIANNVNPSFLASLYHNPQSNEIIFSILSDDHVRILEKYSYFSELHQLGTRPPFRPQVILNIIPAFLRLIRIKGHIEQGKVKYIDDKFIECLKSLSNFPQLISGYNVNDIVNEFTNTKC